MLSNFNVVDDKTEIYSISGSGSIDRLFSKFLFLVSCRFCFHVISNELEFCHDFKDFTDTASVLK